MKKFLFTLAALLMAVSAFARTDARYLYVDPSLTFFDEEQDSWVLVLSAEFPAYVNGLDVEINLPDGIEIWDAKGGPDYPITWYNRRGVEQTLDPAISQSAAGFQHFIIAISTMGYYEDPVGSNNWVSHSAIKWAAGYYQKFIYLYVDFDASYEGPTDGSNITVSTTPSSGIDPRGLTVKDEEIGDQGQQTTSDPYTPPTAVDPAKPEITWETLTDKVVVTVTWNESDGEKVYTGLYEYIRPEYGQPDESYDVEAYTLASATYNASPKAEATIPVPAKDPVWQDVAAPVISYETGDDVVTVTIEWPTTTGEHVYTGQYTYTRPEAGQPDESYDVEAYTLADYPYNASPKAEATIPVPAKEPVVIPQTAKPTITPVTNEDGSVTVTVTGEGTLNVLIEGYDLELDVITYTGPSPYVITLQQAEEAQEIVVSATAQKENELESEPAIAQFEIEAKPYVPVLLTGEIEFSAVNQENGQFTVTYTGNEEGVIITLNDETITLVAGKGTTTAFQLPTYGTYPVVATAKAIGYDNEITGEATLVWEAPVTPELPAVPEITINMDDNNVYVGATTQEGATTTLYQVTYDDDGNEILTPINNPQAFARGVENYEVKVKAVAENAAGESWSEVITIPVPSGTTGINEMIDGKAIANVRYFNMAGQEMTEANGVTIVVTTYTDGTTSAVKVMK